MSLLEEVLRCLRMFHICQKIQVILGPELLCLLEEQARLELRVLLLGMLQTPPLFASDVASKLGQFASMDTNRHISELGSVIGDHLSSSLLVDLLPSSLRGWHQGENAKVTVFTTVHTGIAVSMIAHFVFHLLQLISHLLASDLLKLSLPCDGRIIHKVEGRSLDLILLILDHISEIRSLSLLLLLVFPARLNRGEARILSVEF